MPSSFPFSKIFKCKNPIATMITRSLASPQFKPVTHVIFDVDGTLLDTDKIHSEVVKEIGEKYGKTFTAEIRHKIAGTRQTDYAAVVVAEMQLPLTKEDFLRIYRQMGYPRVVDCKLLPGAEKLIRHLHVNKVPIAVATSAARESFERKTRNHKAVFDLFDHVVCGFDPELKRGKPFPDIFLLCASRFPDKPDPSKCLVFEDAPHGVTAALQAGMQVVMIPEKDVPEELWKSATLKVDSLNDFVPELFGLPPY